ncbi:type I restriction-modification system subunit M N-terminal domain-containing protein, partial [uncultured Spongiibacter sp.]
MNSIATTFSGTAAFIWSVADLLRGDFKQSQYGRIILPFTLLRRLECVLEPTKAAVLKQSKAVEDMPEEAARKLLLHSAAQPFYNTSHMDLGKLGQNQVLENLESYIHSFSPDAREIFDYFSFTDFLVQLNDANLLFRVAGKFAEMDLHPETLSNHDMGLVFEELIRRFAESSNETAGEHFTPRDIVR